jgi:hypothetical protein
MAIMTFIREVAVPVGKKIVIEFWDHIYAYIYLNFFQMS